MLTRDLEETLSFAVDEAVKHKHEYVTLEHLLYALLENAVAREILVECGAEFEELARALVEYFEHVLEKVPESVTAMPGLTSTFQSTISYAVLQAEGSGQRAVDGGNILAAMYQAEQSYAVYLLLQQQVTRLDVLNYICHGLSKHDEGDAVPVYFAIENLMSARVQAAAANHGVSAETLINLWVKEKLDSELAAT